MIEDSAEQSHKPASDGAVVENTSPCQGEKEPRARGLLAIGLFKISKAVFFSLVGAGALHLIHKDVGELFLKLVSVLRLDTEARFVGALQDMVDLMTGHRLREVSLMSFGYSAVSLTEGIGLMMQQTWAEYLTLILTTGALPWEVYELFKHGTAIRAVVLAVNLAVLAYLVWFIRWHRKRMRGENEERSVGG